MRIPSGFWERLIVLLAGAFLGAVAGLIVNFATGFLDPPPMDGAKVYPLPHTVPKNDNMIALRFAMVHDVLVERFPRHGTDYYRERNRRVREELDRLKGQQPPPKEYFSFVDDLAVGLELVGEHDEAIRLMRDKLQLQKSLGHQGAQLYSTHANLGTFLILGPFRKVIPGDTESKKQLKEGLAHIHESIRVNPQAHFGREIWQAVIVEYMAASLDNPDVLLQFDMIGNRLTEELNPGRRRAAFGMGLPDFPPDLKSLTEEQREKVRSRIAPVGADPGWKEAVPSAHDKPVPFDEPCLGIVGMWRLGGGAHPYFSLALAETMTRVGQRRIAWNAYERTADMAELYWPDPAIQHKLVEHCRRRQQVLEDGLSEDAAALRNRFRRELAHGQRYQEQYQQYEAEKIAAGVSPLDPHFHDEFNANHPIATPVGDWDAYAVKPSRWQFPRHVPWPSALLFAGLSTFGMALLLRFSAPRPRGGRDGSPRSA